MESKAWSWEGYSRSWGGSNSEDTTATCRCKMVMHAFVHSLVGHQSSKDADLYQTISWLVRCTRYYIIAEAKLTG